MASHAEADYRVAPWHQEPDHLAAWIWEPSTLRNHRRARILQFSLDFEVEKSVKLQLAVSADQRYQLFLDGRTLSYGPDRSDVRHWPAAFLNVPVEADAHQLVAFVWWLGEHGESMGMPEGGANPPMAQTSWRGGFYLAGHDWAEKLSTGVSEWRYVDLTDHVKMRHGEWICYHDIGTGYRFEMEGWRAAQPDLEPAVIRDRIKPSPYGLDSYGWRLLPASLPEQRRASFRSGRIVGCRRSWDEAAWREDELRSSDADTWQDLLTGASACVDLPAQSEVTLLWDFEQYACGYPDLGWSGGKGAEVECQWAESLYECEHSNALNTALVSKGNRNVVAGKSWLGFGDLYVCSGRDDEQGPALWWRSGRYLRVRIRTQDEPIAMTRLRVLTTGFPMDEGSRWQSSDTSWDAVMPLLKTALTANAHETWVDCPYYEQMMYVGDTRLHMLNNYICYVDDRLSRRALELFDWSRYAGEDGLVAERYPSFVRQNSTTYAMIWIWMVRDFLMWRNDLAFARERLPGVRQMMESLLALTLPDGRLGQVPGWSFVDWVPSWQSGCGPGVRDGDSSIVNLHLVLTYQAAAESERVMGEQEIAARWDRRASELMSVVLDRYWDDGNGYLRDTTTCDEASEHAQVLAVLSGLLPEDVAAKAMRYVLSGRARARTSIYFSHYLLELYAMVRNADAFWKRLEFWKDLPGQGFVGLPESPGHCRSDCHGWGAHPLFHTYATIAGIRPTAPGFREVSIHPLVGQLDSFSVTMPHPQGTISVQAQQLQSCARFTIELPDGVPGTLHWKGQAITIEDRLAFEED